MVYQLLQLRSVEWNVIVNIKKNVVVADFKVLPIVYRGCFPRGETINAKIKNAWSFTSTASYVFMEWYLSTGTPIPLPLSRHSPEETNETLHCFVFKRRVS
jgi:hypothetical protein